MKKLPVQWSPQSEEDLNELYRYIAYELFLPAVADKYVAGVVGRANGLSSYGASLAVSQNERLRILFGNKVHSIRYKKMAIVYTVLNNEQIHVLRILPGSLLW
jgi:plasmid stabilization system protein ParE